MVRGVEWWAMLQTLRWLMFVVLVAIPAGAIRAETVASLPAPTGYVNDFAGVLTPETRQSLEDLCTQVDQQAHAQIAVVTVKSLDSDKSGATPTIEQFATALEEDVYKRQLTTLSVRLPAKSFSLCAGDAELG